MPDTIFEWITVWINVVVGVMMGWFLRDGAHRHERRGMQNMINMCHSAEAYLLDRSEALRKYFRVGTRTDDSLVSDLHFATCENCDVQYFFDGCLPADFTQCPKCHHIQEHGTNRQPLRSEMPQ